MRTAMAAQTSSSPAPGRRGCHACAYCDSCHEYCDFISRPVPKAPLRGNDWDARFSHWSSVQFWLYVLDGAAWIAWGVIWQECGCFSSMLTHYAVGIVSTFFCAHLSWFFVVRLRGSRIHPHASIVNGVIWILHGLNWLKYALGGSFFVQLGIHYTPAMSHEWVHRGSLVRGILYGVYSFSVIYLGIVAVMIFYSISPHLGGPGILQQSPHDSELGDEYDEGGSRHCGDSTPDETERLFGGEVEDSMLPTNERRH
eukprot:gnl/TRDRNA2_/TRDRNA2_83870_c0_seq1.p1 gnl/TRDRNA2_/TRDRNA2_83870_c0~~gnl/TRDRNA2_/TRDRNA2_83870_c0_seq1.p1  ORF type:complete len:255 (+),score=22.34 gnl/TRDRNA2_/TRDRNA2_83870_c0_seq1:47-811(+)